MVTGIGRSRRSLVKSSGQMCRPLAGEWMTEVQRRRQGNWQAAWFITTKDPFDSRACNQLKGQAQNSSRSY